MNDQEKQNLIRLFNTQDQSSVDNAFILLLTFLRCPFKAIKFYIDNAIPVLKDTGKTTYSLDPRRTLHLGTMIVPLFNEPSERTYAASGKDKFTINQIKVLKERVLKDYNFYSLAQVDEILNTL